MKFLEVDMMENAALGMPNASADVLVQLGLMYSTGRTVPADRVAAHKWFNLAAHKGNKDAARLRLELAEEMSEFEVAEAQRAAREWLTSH